ncbi:MAG: PleD family two-component system response regulator, partial [Acidobacteriota bacterium]
MARILVVDDQADILETTCAMLRKDDHEVITARDGVEGLERARSEKPDLILLDIEMPGMDGWEMLRLLRLEESTRRVPVAMFTILFDLREKVRALKYGAQEYVTKPFKMQDLLARV